MQSVTNAAFLETVVRTIPGWLEDYTALRTMDLLDWQDRMRIRGPLLEIGVFAGRYFSILLRSAVRTGDAIVGLDTFQWVDEPTVRSHLAKVVPRHHAQLIRSFSTDLTASELLGVLGAKARFVSVDGSHERNDVVWDLRLTEEILAPKGIAAIDDFLNPLTLGVNDGVNVFFSQPRGLAPFAYIANKLFLTRPAMATELKNELQALIEKDDDHRSVDFRDRAGRGLHHAEQPMWGYPILIIP